MIRISIFLIVCLVWLVIAPATEAQQLFVIPDTSPNYSSYKHMDECIASVQRLKSYETAKDTIWRDTSVWEDEDVLQPMPLHIVQIGASCMEKVEVDTLPKESIHFWASGLLSVDRDSDVERMYRAYFDSIPSGDRLQAFRQAIYVYRNARPMRLDAIESLYNWALEEAGEGVGQDTALFVLGLNLSIFNNVYRKVDIDKARAHVESMLSIIDTIPVDIKRQSSYSLFAAPLFAASVWLYEREGLDSLSLSVASYLNHLKRLYNRISIDSFENNMIIGTVAPRVHGEFFYKLHESRLRKRMSSVQSIVPQAVPVRGKINLIAFVQGGCHKSTPSATQPSFMRNPGLARCWPLLSSIRRINESYPEVEISIVTKTFGNFATSPALEPREEADSLARYFLGFHRINGNVIVEKTPYFRLPGFDNRRIDAETENEIRYTLQGKPRASHLSAILTDENGVVIHSDEMGSIFGEGEEILKKKIEALLRRFDPER